MELVTKNTLADLIKADPRSGFIELPEPVATLVTMKRRVPLYSIIKPENQEYQDGN
jgi:hypothetical protein